MSMAIWKWQIVWGLLIGMSISGAATALGKYERRGVNSTRATRHAAIATKEKAATRQASGQAAARKVLPAPAGARHGRQTVDALPASLEGFKGRLLGEIAEVNAQGIVLTNIQRVEKEVPGGLMGMSMTTEATPGSPEDSLRGKTVQLICEDTAYKKKYQRGQIIFGQVEWSPKAKGLVINGAQWQGLAR